MTESITKACETCAGVGRPMTWNGTVDCVDCSGTGRVTDVEATLRAEVGRLTDELAAERERSRRAAKKRKLQGEATKRARARLQTAAKFTRLTAEVERLKAMTIEAVKGTSLTIIDAIGGTAQQTIEGLRADPEFAEVALRAQLDAAQAEVARLERDFRAQGLAYKDAADWGVAKTKEKTELRAEVTRLTAELDAARVAGFKP